MDVKEVLGGWFHWGKQGGGGDLCLMRSVVEVVAVMVVMVKRRQRTARSG